MKITVNQQLFDLSQSPEILGQADIVALGPNRYHLLVDGQSLEAEVVCQENGGKIQTLKINGKLASVEIKDRFDLLLEQMGFSSTQKAGANQLKAPMPGLILDVLVAPGQAVSKGTPLLILEAMKMENVLKAPADAVVSQIPVAKGDKVEKNAVLVVFGA